MSSAEIRLPADVALEAATKLATVLQLGEHTLAGSLRRGCPDVGDVEFLVPMPQSDGLRPAVDRLHQELCERFRLPEDADNIFGGPREPIGEAVKGLRRKKPGFRYCQVVLNIRPTSPRAVEALARYGRERLPLTVEFWRYDPGLEGNRGWIELIRTGPGDFGEACLARWKALTGGQSAHGYPHTADGMRVPVPTEQRAFDLLQLPYIAPEDRTASAVRSAALPRR